MKEERLKELLDKYYDGETSEAEEDELKVYFSGERIIEGYESERDIFMHYSRSETMPIPSLDFRERIIIAVDDLDKSQNRISARKRYIFILSAAAAVLMLIGSYFVFFSQKEPEDTFSDPQLAYAAAMEILNEVSIKLNAGTRALKPLSRIQDATRTGFSSIDKSSVIISKNLQRIKLLEQISETGNQMNINNSNKYIK
jgi:hypothetical protein